MSIFALAWAKLRKQLGSSVYTLYNVQCIIEVYFELKMFTSKVYKYNQPLVKCSNSVGVELTLRMMRENF